VFKQSPKLDFAPYLRGFAVLARNPALVLPPLVAAVVAVFVSRMGGSGVGEGNPVGMVSGSLTSLLVTLLESFAWACSIVLADAAWRRGGTAPFEASISEARRRGGDILFAAIGYSFVLSLAALVGGIVPIVGFVLVAVAVFFFIWTIPAAAIGGIPGGASLNRSLELARANPVPTAIFAVVYFVLVNFVAPTVTSLRRYRLRPENVVRTRAAAFAAAYGLVVLALFASDAHAAAYPAARDPLTLATRTFLFLFGPMWALGIAIATWRPTTKRVTADEGAANGQTAALGAALVALASCAPWATIPLEALALVAVAGALGSPTLGISLDRALVERFAHLSLIARSLLIATILGIYAVLVPPIVVEIGYLTGPSGFGEWPFVATLAAVPAALLVTLGGFFVGATFPKAASQPRVAGDEASASAASSTQPVSQHRPG
jgi:hypothetical protein